MISADLTYQECLGKETETMIAALGKDADPKAIEKLTAEQTSKGNTAVDELTALAAEFKKQLEVFKQRAK